MVSPVTPSELADFLGLVYDPLQDDLLNSFLLASCHHYIKHSNNELLPRDYVLKFDRHPESQPAYSGLGVEPGRLEDWVSIPVYPMTAVSSVTANGEDVLLTTGIDYEAKPQRIQLKNRSVENIVIEYTAGYPAATAIPASVLLGIKMMSAYLYEHRGACDVDDAAQKSGAKSIWFSEMMILNL